MNSFYINGHGAVGASAALLPGEARHACQVLRLHEGDEICAVDETGARFLAELTEVGKGDCVCRLLELLPDTEAAVHITVYQGLPKGERLESIAQKLTELGAYRLVLVKMERCVVRPDEGDAQRKQARLERIAREAVKQCGRGMPPHIEAARTWQQLEDDMRRHDLLLVPWEEASGRGLKRVHEVCPEARDIGIVIGPEGGMSTAEVEALVALGGQTVTLGPRILRTDTAAVATCAMVMLLWGDMG